MANYGKKRKSYILPEKTADKLADLVATARDALSIPLDGNEKLIADIADNGNLPAAEKLRRLDAFKYKVVRRPLRIYDIGASCYRVHPQHDEPHGCDGERKRTSCRDQRLTSQTTPRMNAHKR